MPVLDLGHFLQMLDARDGKCGQISLFLYQAILFAGAAHVNISHLREAGFTTRKHALKELFQRARVRSPTILSFRRLNDEIPVTLRLQL